MFRSTVCIATATAAASTMVVMMLAANGRLADAERQHWNNFICNTLLVFLIADLVSRTFAGMYRRHCSNALRTTQKMYSDHLFATHTHTAWSTSVMPSIMCMWQSHSFAFLRLKTPNHTALRQQRTRRRTKNRNMDWKKTRFISAKKPQGNRIWSTDGPN